MPVHRVEHAPVRSLQSEVNRLFDDLLTLRGEKREERSGEQGGSHWTERRQGAFRRSFPLPCEVDGNRVEASLRRGVLTVKLPKTAESQRRTQRIEVRPG